MKSDTRMAIGSRAKSLLLLIFFAVAPLRAAENLLQITPDMLSGSLTFFASPAGLNFNAPIPYGINNNLSDSGWIWPQDNSGLLQVDFRSATDVRKFRAYSSYNGGSRGANWAIERSDDGQNWTPVTDFAFITQNGGGVDDSGTPVAGSGGWYEANFNPEGQAARYWRVRQTQVIVSHAPRVAQVEFYGASPGPVVRSTFPIGRGVRGTENILVEILDGTVTQLAPALVTLLINGQTATPVVTKAPGTNITSVTFDPPQPLPAGSNTVGIIFDDTGTPPGMQTNFFSFEVADEAESALVINIDFNGSRNDPGPDVPGPTYIGLGAVGGGNVWNGIAVDSRDPDVGDDDNLTITANDLLTSLGDPTTVDFTISPVGGDVETATPSARSSPALFGDIAFVGFGAQISLTSDFTISGLDEDPFVDLYFYSPIGTIDVEGAERTLIPLSGIFARANTHYFTRVPVVNGEVKGTFSGDPGKLAGLTIARLPLQPFVKSNQPGPGSVRTDAPIEIELQDYKSQINQSSIKLSVNGQPVEVVIDKPAGGIITKVTYNPTNSFPLGLNSYQIVFGNGTTTQTNNFTFKAIPDDQILVTREMLSGTLNFFGTPPGMFFVEPIPYGVEANANDVGWIWPSDNTGVVKFDLQTPTALSRLRVFSSWAGGARGAIWSIDHSDDGVNWTPLADFPFETKIGVGLNDDGTKRADTAGWYEAVFNQRGTEQHRYWQVRQSQVTVMHAPRASEMQLFSALPLPSVRSISPVGRNIQPAEEIRIELQDNITAVRQNSIQLSLNGQTVTPVISKEPGSLITVLTYNPPGDLKSGDNTVDLVFGNDATPSVSQTFESTFSVQGGALYVDGTMLSGPLNFFASPPGLTFGSPIPYGIPNNVNDSGWIWPSDNSGSLTVDFGLPAVVQKFRAFASYGGASRGAVWTIEYSNDNASWSKAYDFTFQTSAGGGIDDDGTARTDFGGWYSTPAFNTEAVAARYWRVRQTGITATHAPRTAQVEFSGALIEPLVITPDMLSGGLTFYASPAGLTFAEPIPYGIPNNVADLGWIWPQDNSGELVIDLQTPQAVNLVRVFSSFPGAGRGALWTVERSDDGTTWSKVADFPFETTAGGGVDEEGSKRTDFGGWYSSPAFNSERAAARYWRLQQESIINGHSPRSAQIALYSIANLPAPALRVNIAREGTDIIISWTGSAALQSASSLTGQWTNVAGGDTSPFRVPQATGNQFYRLTK